MPNGINFSGLGSGIDFGVITDAIIAQARRPVAQLQTRRDNLDERVKSLRQLNTGLVALTEAAKALTDRTIGTGRNSSSSDNTILSATSTSTAAIGKFTVNVERLATSFTQATTNFASASTAILSGGEASATFKLRKGGSTDIATITINSSNNSLEGLRNAINEAKVGVTATIVDVSGTGTQNRLVLTSTETGATGRVQLIDDTNSATFANLSLSSLNPPGATTDFSALNAKLTINGLTIYRASNTVSDAVTGVTLNLQKIGEATVNVATATDDVKNKLTNFINAYNAIQDAIAGQYKTDAKGKPTGILAGDSTLRLVQNQLRDAVGASSKANGGVFSSLAEIGLTRDDSGKLKLDTAVLDEKLKNSFSDVQALLSGLTGSQTGLANSIYNTSFQLSDSISGVVQTTINGYTNSLSNLEKAIAAQEERISAMRASLIRQFSITDAAISQLNGQGTALSNSLKALEPRRDR